MLFSSPLFLFIFFPLFLAAYYVLPHRFRNGVVLSASVYFYAWGEPRFVFIVLLSALFDWLLGNVVRDSKDEKVRRLCVGVDVASNLGILFYFKYTNFFIDSIGQALRLLHLNVSMPILHIALPIGVSFIVFEKITYIVDLYRGTGRAAPRLSSYLLYVFFFPKLLAGPIIKYHDIAPQLESRTVDRDDVVYGITRFCQGLAKKVLIADVLSRVVESVFTMPAGHIGFANAWLGLFCFTLQIFFDFSGYSDMAIGIARLVGFRLMENFDSPYISANFTEFWRRWHISLSTWIREYLYFPLGGNRVSTARTYLNLWLCFLASGIWHGAKWTFVLWGAYQGTFLALDKLCWLRASRRLPHVVNVILCFGLTMIGWVLFRADDLSRAIVYYAALFDISSITSPSSHSNAFLRVAADVPLVVAVGLLLSFLPAFPAYAALRQRSTASRRLSTIQLGLAGVLLFICLCRAASTTFQPFLYFRF